MHGSKADNFRNGKTGNSVVFIISANANFQGCYLLFLRQTAFDRLLFFVRILQTDYEGANMQKQNISIKQIIIN